MRVVVNGAGGKMGIEVCKAVQNAPDLHLAGGVDPRERVLQTGARTFANLKDALDAIDVDVVVDFTTPAAVSQSMETCLQYNVPMVIGTTGFSEEDLKEWQVRALQENWKAIIAPNFAIGAVLMMKYAQEAVRFLNTQRLLSIIMLRSLMLPQEQLCGHENLCRKCIRGKFPFTVCALQVWLPIRKLS